MAGRRRRTPAAALRWPRCRCRCRSSSRSTCAGIECHSSPRAVFMICPRDILLDGVEGHDGLRLNSQDNLAHWSSSTQSFDTNRGRRWARPGRIQFWVLRSRRRRQRTELSSFSAQIDRAVHAARRLDAAASGTWALGGLKRWPAGRSTTRTSSFMIMALAKIARDVQQSSAGVFCV